MAALGILLAVIGIVLIVASRFLEIAILLVLVGVLMMAVGAVGNQRRTAERRHQELLAATRERNKN